MIVVYLGAIVGVLCLIAAARDWRFPFSKTRVSETPDTPPAFETSEGGETVFEDGSVEGYDTVSRATRGGKARFSRADVRKKP